MSDSLGIALRFALYLDLMLLFGLGLFGVYGLQAAERQSGAVLNFKGWLAGTAVLGVLLGTQVGVYVQHRSKAKTHKLVMVALLLGVAAIYLFRVGR